MIGLDDFWGLIDAQLTECRKARSFADVKAALGGATTFYGSGGDDQMFDALSDAGWRWITIPNGWEHHYQMLAPNGDVMEYCEGDISLVPNDETEQIT